MAASQTPRFTSLVSPQSSVAILHTTTSTGTFSLPPTSSHLPPAPPLPPHPPAGTGSTTVPKTSNLTGLSSSIDPPRLPPPPSLGESGGGLGRPAPTGSGVAHVQVALRLTIRDVVWPPSTLSLVPMANGAAPEGVLAVVSGVHACQMGRESTPSPDTPQREPSCSAAAFAAVLPERPIMPGIALSGPTSSSTEVAPAFGSTAALAETMCRPRRPREAVVQGEASAARGSRAAGTAKDRGCLLRP